MGLFSRPEERSAPLQYSAFSDAIFDTPQSTSSGMFINAETALKYSVVWSAVGLIVDSVSFLRPRAVLESDDGEIEAASLPNWVRKPHPTLRRSDVFAQMLTSAILWGNGYAMITRNGTGGIQGLVPIDSSRVNCQWVDPTERIYRYYQIDNGSHRYDEREIFHIQGLTLPGLPTGMSVISQARESIGLGLTLEDFGARYFSQGSQAKVVLKMNKALDEKQARDVVANYERFHKGKSNWHRPAVAGQGVDIQQISIPPDDAQFLESREFQATDVARWFRVPPHRVGIVSKQSSWGSGLAEENTALTQYTFRPWIQRLEAAFTAYTAGGEDQGVLIRFDDSDLQRGSFDEQVTAWETAVTGQIATPNEARKALGLGAIEGGDKLITPPAPMGQDPQQNNGKPQSKPNPGGDPNGQNPD